MSAACNTMEMRCNAKMHTGLVVGIVFGSCVKLMVTIMCNDNTILSIDSL